MNNGSPPADSPATEEEKAKINFFSVCYSLIVIYLEQQLVVFDFLQLESSVDDIQLKLRSRCVDVHHRHMQHKQLCEMESIFLESNHLRDEHELRIVVHLLRLKFKND